MALTINTHPDEVITNAPEFDVTTSLSESASQQNLRIRATVYMGGVSSPVVVLEQAKGLDDWNFFDFLKSLTGKCNAAIGAATQIATPTLSSELLSSWTDLLSSFETFTTSGRVLTSVIDSNASGGICASNDMGALSKGDIIIVGLDNDYNDSGVADFELSLVGNVGLDLQSKVNYSGLSSGKLINNHIYALMVTEDLTTSYVTLSTSAGSNAALTGTVTVHEITDFLNNPGAYFMVKFEEVYEDASNVTTIGAESWSDTLLFVPVILRPGESFTDYIMNGNDDKFLTRGRDSMIQYKYGIDMELRTLFISTAPYVRQLSVVDAGTEYSSTKISAGWGLSTINDNSVGIDAQDETIEFKIISTDITGASTRWTSETITVKSETNCHPDIKALSFIGDLGEETIIFRGLPTERGIAEKTFIKNQRRNRKVLKAFKGTIEILRTLYETEEVRRLLHQLTYTELPAWMYDSDFTDGYREVTVITDEVAIENQKQLIESEIEVEYYE